MAALKSSAKILVLVVVALASQAHVAKAQQTCSHSLTSLNQCAPFLLSPSNAAPSGECCTALSSISHDCVCNTVNIVAQLPSRCNLPPVSCPNANRDISKLLI